MNENERTAPPGATMTAMRSDQEGQESVWRMGLRDLITKHPLITVLILVLAILGWQLVGYGVDKASSAPVQTQVVQKLAPDCGDACATTAARKFRRHRITHNRVGIPARRAFARPKVSKRIVVNKFQRLLHRKYGSSQASARGSGNGICTTDTQECAQDWYARAMTRNCIAVGPVYEGGKQRCTEDWNLDITPATTREKVRALACVGTSALTFAPGPGWVRVAAFPGAVDNCWDLVD